MIEINRVGFYKTLPDDIRATVDMMVPQFLAESWPVQFVALLSMLEDMTNGVDDEHRPFVVNEWVIIVSALVECLPRDLSSPECRALMRHCVIAAFQRRALACIPDLSTEDEFLRWEYPQWPIVADLLHEYQVWAVKRHEELTPWGSIVHVV